MIAESQTRQAKVKTVNIDNLIYVYIYANEKEEKRENSDTHKLETIYIYDYHEFVENPKNLDLDHLNSNPESYLNYTPSQHKEETSMDKFARLVVNTISLTNEESLEIKDLYPTFDMIVGMKVKKGFKFQYGDDLYETLQDLTIESFRFPQTGTESLYMKINETNKGTIDDPIPWEKNMILYQGKYYTQFDKLYLCTRDSGIALHYDLKDLVGQFVSIVD